MKNNIVYSTDNSFEMETSNEKNINTLTKEDLRIYLDRRKAGKIVTIIKGFKGNRKQLEDYAALIKKKCGVGGSVKNNENSYSRKCQRNCNFTIKKRWSYRETIRWIIRFNFGK